MSVGVRKGVQRVVWIDAEALRRNKHGAGGAERNIAAAFTDRAGADRGRGIVTRTGADPDLLREAERSGYFRLQRTDGLIAFIEQRHLRFGNAAECEHLLRPALMLDIEQQHTARVGVVRAVDAGEDIVDVILWQHDFADTRKILRLVLSHPQELWRGKARKGNIGGPRRELVPTDTAVELLHLGAGAAVVPEDRGADDRVVLVKHHKSVHLPACADPGHLRFVEALEQTGDARQHGALPVLGILLAPAGVGKFQRVGQTRLVQDPASLIHQQQLDSRGTEINSNIQHHNSPLNSYHIIYSI